MNLKHWLVPSGNGSNIAVRRAQVTAFSRLIPLLYFGLSVNCAMLAFTHYSYAPAVLTIIFPACVFLICAARTIVWRQVPVASMSDEAVNRRFGVVFRFGTFFGFAILVWALSLYRYGNVQTQSHVVLSVSVTVFASVFCLMHLRDAALLLTAILVIPFTSFLLLSAEAINVAVAINILLLAVVVVIILLIVSRDFVRMVEAQLEMQRLSDENSRLAALDSLTGLPNRREFFQALAQRLRETEASGQQFAVGVIDLDGFKPINDLYGHAAGDQVLREVSERLRAAANGKTFVARLGGDEFGLVFRVAEGEAAILAAGERLCSALRRPYSIPGVAANLSASVGVALSSVSRRSAELLYECADYALYKAKQNSRGRPVVFSSEHEAEMHSQNIVAQCLGKANLEAELSLEFQPLFDVEQNRIIALEALARWQSPELGHVPPGVFIAVAERTDFINALGLILLRKTLRAASEWPEDVHVSFNLSPHDLVSQESILNIIDLINSSGFPPRRLDLEITETALMTNFDQAQRSILALKTLGARISLDDFGTGYSSLSYVHQLPLDNIKIDRSFVTDIETSKSSRDIVRAVVGLCRDLGINCIAEGMETEGQANVLRTLGCKAMQGYFFGRPLPERAVPDVLANRSTRLRLQTPNRISGSANQELDGRDVHVIHRPAFASTTAPR